MAPRVKGPPRAVGVLAAVGMPVGLPERDGSIGELAGFGRRRDLRPWLARRIRSTIVAMTDIGVTRHDAPPSFRHAVVVYESLWGNTAQLAHQIAAGIGGERTDVVDVSSSPSALASDVDLLVVGGPTHAFGMSTQATRDAATSQGAEHIPQRGIREWIEQLTPPSRAVPVATFDTRVVQPRLPGSAAKKAMKRLVARGFAPIAAPETFGVHGYGGPLADGETERARRWGEQLAGLAGTATPTATRKGDAT